MKKILNDMEIEQVLGGRQEQQKDDTHTIVYGTDDAVREFSSQPNFARSSVSCRRSLGLSHATSIPFSPERFINTLL